MSDNAMTNFAFLHPEFSELADTAIEAESLIYTHPPSAIVMARKSVETLVSWLYQSDSTLQLPYDTSLQSLLNLNSG